MGALPELEETITINGKQYQLVTVQRGGDARVYRSAEAYLRIGKPEKIARDLALHKKMQALGFPVARVLGDGEREGERYFIEESLGEERLDKVFTKDIAERGSITPEHLATFIEVAVRFGKAQLRTVMATRPFDAFACGIHLADLMNEFPERANDLARRFEEAKKRLAAYPFVVTHGDFNPSNLFARGAIDFEDSFPGPLGYDLVTAFTHVDFFPDSDAYEYFTRYRFNAHDRATYMGALDVFAKEAGVPPFPDFTEDFTFCRGAWSAAHMGKWPKLQRFRFDLLVSRFLDTLPA